MPQKEKKYSYKSFGARLHLAALDHNTNVERQKAKTKTGEDRFKQQFSKAVNQYVVSQIKEKKGYSFRREIVCGAISRCNASASLETALEEQGGESQFNVTLGQHRGLERPEKAKSVAKHLSRFT